MATSTFADIRTFGAKPNDNTYDNVRAIMRAHDTLLDANGILGQTNNSRGVLYIPVGIWYIGSPLWLDGDNITVQGDGRFSCITANADNNGVCIFLGKKRKQIFANAPMNALPSTFSTDHRFDLFGKLDSSAVAQSGQLYGLTTLPPSNTTGQPDNYLCFWGASPSFGAYDQWSSTNKLTLQISFSLPNNGPIGWGPICGFGDKADYGGPYPWMLMAGDSLNTGDSRFHFTFRTTEGGKDSTGKSYIREFAFGNINQAGTHHICIQIDMSNNNASGVCAIQAYDYNPTTSRIEQLAVYRIFGTSLTTATASEPSFTANDKLHFLANDIGSFLVGSWGGAAYNTLDSIKPLNLYGLKVGTSPIYLDNGAGSQQARIDGTAANDSKRYLDGADLNTTIAYLPMTDKPNEPTRATNRVFKVITGGASPYSNYHQWGYFQADRNKILNSSTQYQTLSRLRVESNPFTGIPLACGLVFYGTTLDCEFMGGWWGVAGNGEGGYDYFFRNNLMYGRDSWLQFTNAILEVDGLTRMASGRTCVRLDGCNARIRKLKTADATGTQAYVLITGASSYASEYVLEELNCDNEGHPLPTQAAIYCERHPSVFTSLRVFDFDPGTIPSNIPAIKLVDPYPTLAGSPAKFYGQNIGISAQGIYTDSPNWEGILDDCLNESLTSGQAWRIHAGTEGSSHLMSRHRMDSLPMSGFWVANGNEIELRQPSPASTRKYTCAQSGMAQWSASVTYPSDGVFVWNNGVPYWSVPSYNANVTYLNGDKVYYASPGNQHVYQCKVASSQGVTPDTATNFTDLGLYSGANSAPPAAGWVAMPAWSSATSYDVSHGYPRYVISGGNIWLGSKDSTNQQPVVGSAYWALFGRAAQARFAADAPSRAMTTKTAAYTPAYTDGIIRCDATAGAFIITLPDTSLLPINQQFIIKKIDSSANIITIATTSGQTIDGATTQSLTSQNVRMTVVSDGSNWFLV